MSSFNRLASLASRAALFVLFVCLSACRDPATDAVVTRGQSATIEFDCGNGLRYPTSEADFRHVYAGRVFYAPGGSGPHLGYDIAYPEGTPIYPMACGRVVVYRSATGYGTLAVVIEHRLMRPVQVRNGQNEEVSVSRFISIYGHLRPTSGRNGGTSTGLTDGQVIMPDRIIGYIENGADNGDGAEHVHFGIRLQSYAEATDIHPRSPFRGYDADRDGRRWFADPADFMGRLRLASGDVRWHPTGSFLVNQENREEAFLVRGDSLERTDPTFRLADRLDRNALLISPAEIACYRPIAWSPPHDGTAFTRLVRFEGESAVYELHATGAFRYTYISWEAFLSWGVRDSDIERYPLSARIGVLSQYTDRGFRRMSPGSLVRARGSPEVAVVSEMQRLPFHDWETFVAMGYDASRIYTIEPDVIDAVAYPRGAMITSELALLCRVPPCMGGSCPDAGSHGGGSGEASECPLGSSSVCPCTDGRSGTQMCLGDRYDACDCGPTMLCMPGAGRSCSCPGGQIGTQTCNAAGEGYAACNCAPICSAPSRLCGLSCVNPQTDNVNCGGCGRVCGAGSSCTAGVCDIICPPSTSFCGSYCTNLQNDINNCSACGRTCPSGQRCNAAACVPMISPVCTPGTSQTCDCSVGRHGVQICNSLGSGFGTCVCAAPTGCDPGTTAVCSCSDGRSGSQACQSDRTYAPCVCAPACSVPLSLCGSSCTNLQSDVNHCGGCGQACLTSQSCQLGSCIGGTGLVCLPGASPGCNCPDGRRGARICNSAGSGWNDCLCTGPLECAPGMSQGCRCADGRMGARTCRSDRIYDGCVCI